MKETGKRTDVCYFKARQGFPALVSLGVFTHCCICFILNIVNVASRLLLLLFLNSNLLFLIALYLVRMSSHYAMRSFEVKL